MQGGTRPEGWSVGTPLRTGCRLTVPVPPADGVRGQSGPKLPTATAIVLPPSSPPVPRRRPRARTLALQQRCLAPGLTGTGHSSRRLPQARPPQPAVHPCSRSNTWVFTKKKKESFVLFGCCLRTEVNHSRLAAGPLPSPPQSFHYFFFNLLVFFYEILRVSSNRTGFICHSVNQNSFSVTRPRVCSGKVIDVLKNLLEVSWAPRGPSKRRLRRAPHAGGFPSCRQVFPGAREGSGSIRNGSGDGGGGRGGRERSQGTVSQALGLPLHSCSLFPPPHPRPRLLSVREGRD